jgi:hypothetical protein
MYIGIDFDGTCVTHEYPQVGRDIGAVPILKRLVEKGHKLILYTMRDRVQLEDAVNWFNKNGIKLYSVNKNPTQKSWTSSPKIYANLYIDDASLGVPLNTNDHEKPFVDWGLVEWYLIRNGILDFKDQNDI